MNWVSNEWIFEWSITFKDNWFGSILSGRQTEPIQMIELFNCNPQVDKKLICKLIVLWFDSIDNYHYRPWIISGELDFRYLYMNVRTTLVIAHLINNTQMLKAYPTGDPTTKSHGEWDLYERSASLFRIMYGIYHYMSLKNTKQSTQAKITPNLY